MSVITISDGATTKTVDTAQKKAINVKRTKRYWKKTRQERAAYLDSKKKGQKLAAKVSNDTRERLYAENLVHLLFEGMEPEEVKAYIDMKLAEFLAKQPFWYGSTPGADAKHRASQRQHGGRVESEASST